jgi:hypothetical protein
MPGLQIFKQSYRLYCIAIYVPMIFLTWRGRVHAIYICVPITFLIWRGRVYAIVGMDASTPS